MSDASSKVAMDRKTFLASAIGLSFTALGAGRASAHAKPPAPIRGKFGAPSTLRLVLLGTAGGPILNRKRSQPSSLLIAGDRKYLVDLGYGCLQQLVNVGLAPVDIDAAFITHHHLDHNADLASLISFNWTGGRTRALPIVGPHGTVAMSAAAIEYFANSERIFGGEFTHRVPTKAFVMPKDVDQSGQIYSDGAITVSAVENSHFQTFAHGNDKSFSLRFQTRDRSIVFTGDTGFSDAVVEFARGADVLVSEIIDPEATIQLASRYARIPAAGQAALIAHMTQEHLPAAQVGQIAARAGVKTLVLSHFSPSVEPSSVPSLFFRSIRKFYKGPIVAGRDLMVV